MTFDLRRPGSFDVVRPRQIEVAPGDKILIRANDKRLGLTNGQVFTISSIEPDRALQTKEGVAFRQIFDNGAMATSLHRTRPKAGQPITSLLRQNRLHLKEPTWHAPRPQVLRRAYPGQGAPDGKITRGKSSCRLGCAFRNPPEKASILNRVRAWKQLSIDLAQRITTR